MRWTRASRRLTLWVMVGLALFAALAPAASRALSRYTDYDWSVVCSAYGRLPADSRSLPDDGDAQQAALEHCPFCIVQAAHLAVPPPALDWRPSVHGAPAPQVAVAWAPTEPSVWLRAQPRAPPTCA
jgi:hypothetical protein